MKIEPLSFLSDGLHLKGFLHVPDAGNPVAAVFGSHGLFSDGNSPKQCDMAQCCSEAQIAYFRFSHRGCGDSQGASDDAIDFAGRVRDMEAAIDTVLPRIGLSLPMGLYGSSLGGAVCLAVAQKRQPSAIVTYAAPVRSIGEGELPSPNAIPENILRHPAFAFDLRDHLSAVHHALVVHGSDDPVVPVSHANDIFNGISGPKKLIIQNGGDHPMSLPQHQEQFRKDALAWFRKYLIDNRR